MPLLMPHMGLLRGGSRPDPEILSVNFTASTTSVPGAGSTLAIGDAPTGSQRRFVFAAFGNTNGAPNACQIGGVAATQLYRENSGSSGAACYWLEVGAGTTVLIDPSTSGAFCAVFTVITNGADLDRRSFGGDTAAGPVTSVATENLNVVAGDAVISSAYLGAAGTGQTFTFEGANAIDASGNEGYAGAELILANDASFQCRASVSGSFITASIGAGAVYPLYL